MRLHPVLPLRLSPKKARKGKPKAVKTWTAYEMATASLGRYINSGHIVESSALAAPYTFHIVEPGALALPALSTFAEPGAVALP